jgi:hypothetical protein
VDTEAEAPEKVCFIGVIQNLVDIFYLTMATQKSYKAK